MEEGLVAHIAPSDLCVVGQQLRALLLKELAERIIVLVCNLVLSHNIIIQETGSSVNSEASTISHSHALRHFTLCIEFKFSIVNLNAAWFTSIHFFIGEEDFLFFLGWKQKPRQ